jgi:L-threonylcarbamoyladenylate synthase
MLTRSDAETFARCIAVGGVAVFPADTVYGLACEPDTREAVERLYALKGRSPGKPSAIMFFDLELAFAALPELEPRTRALLSRLMPGGITALLPNPLRRYPLACGAGGGDVHTLGLRVPALEGPIEALAEMRWPVMQSSANVSGGIDAHRLDEVPEEIRRRADLVLDGGELAGTPSTVVDLRRFELDGMWAVLRQGAVPERDIELAAADA